jgi:hypothetical protein
MLRRIAMVEAASEARIGAIPATVVSDADTVLDLKALDGAPVHGHPCSYLADVDPAKAHKSDHGTGRWATRFVKSLFRPKREVNVK